MSGEWRDLESLNCTQTSIPKYCTATPDMSLNYFWSQVIMKTPSKMHHLTTSGGISQEWFKRNFARLSVTIGPTNLPDMTSLAASGLLQNADK